jgi:hypothetical protein
MLLLCACGSNMGGIPGGNGGNGGSGGGAGSGGSGGSGGNGGGTGGNGAVDMANESDAGMVAYGCNEILSCVAMCNGGFANRNCVTMCRAGATSMGRALYLQLSGCLRQACYVHPDAAAEPCTNGGMPSMQCTQCLASAVTASGACHSEYNACAANN